MKFLNKITTSLIVGIISLAAKAQLQTQSFTAEVPNTFTDWKRTLQLPQFNPAVGVLKSINIGLDGQMLTQASFENKSRIRSTPWNFEVTGSMQLFSGVSTVPSLNLPIYYYFSDIRGPFDGVIDFAGVSGIRTPVQTIAAQGAYELNSSNSTIEQMVDYIGFENLSFNLQASARSRYSGPGDFVFAIRTLAGSKLNISYNYVLAQCARSPGYWKNHILKHNVQSLTIGSSVLNTQQLSLILDNKTLLGEKAANNAYIKLARALIATKLSIQYLDAQYFYISAFIDRAEQVLSSVDLTKKKASGTQEMLTYAEYIKNNLELFITGQDYNQAGVCDNLEDKDKDCDKDDDSKDDKKDKNDKDDDRKNVKKSK